MKCKSQNGCPNPNFNCYLKAGHATIFTKTTSENLVKHLKISLSCVTQQMLCGVHWVPIYVLPDSLFFEKIISIIPV